MANLRAAIIGLGPNTPGKGGAHSFGYAHAQAFTDTPGVDLVAGCTRTEKNLADFVAEFPAAAGYRDYREMLAAEPVDIVSVCAWPPDREAMVTAALEAGARAVWIEKPFTLSLGAARRLMAAADAAGARLFVNHQRRYGKPFQWFRDAVQDGRIGTLLSLDIVLGGGSLLNFVPHLVDAALFAIGPAPATRILGCVDLSTAKVRQGAPNETASLAVVHFGDGPRLTIETGSGKCPCPILRANGSNGFAELHLDAGDSLASIFRARYAGAAAAANPATSEHFHHSEDGNLYVRRAAHDIVRALADGGSTLIDASEAYRNMEIVMGLFESDRQGRALALPLGDGEFALPEIEEAAK